MNEISPAFRRIAVCALAIAISVCAAANGQSLQRKAEAHVRVAEPGGAAISVLVVDADTGAELVSIKPDAVLIPASNMKLITSAAALSTLGPKFAFTTKLQRVGNDLVVIGDGDPGFGDPELLKNLDLGDDPNASTRVDALINHWCAAVKRTGRTKFDTIIVDDRVFDDERVHPQWPRNQLHKWYCAQVAAININDNCLDVYARPGKKGARPAIWFAPADAPVEIDNTAKSGTPNAFWLSRRLGTNRLVVRGTLPHTIREPVNVTIDDPPTFFARTLQRRLRGMGVTVADVRRANIDEVFENAELLAMVQTTLPSVVHRCNTDSQNLFAEAMFKRMGHRVSGRPGSWANGSAAVRMFLSRALGTGAAGAVIDDGSGMSRGNRVSPRLLTRLLIHMADDEKLGSMYRESLARPGQDGTLRRRFANVKLTGDIYAKSGYLNGVIALSGYLVHEDRTVVFSIIANDYRKGAYRVYGMTEKIIADVDKELAKPAADAVRLGG